MVEELWQKMNAGGFSTTLRTNILQFNGGLFANGDALPLTKDQLCLLIEAAKADWCDVEPAIFGTLLERALDPVDVSRIRPIAVNAPTLIGLTDVYGSIRPGSGPIDDAIPVARAVAANTSAPSPILLGDEPGDESSDEPEIRKAEPAGPADSLLEPPAVAAPTPEPIRF